MRVATYNLHAGVDGWGRPTAVVDAAAALDADVLVVQESWREAGVDLSAQIAERIGAAVCTTELAQGWRWVGGQGGATWQPRLALLRGNLGLSLDSIRPLSEARLAQWREREGATQGAWCLSILSRAPVLSSEVVELPVIPEDRCARRMLIVRVATPGGPLCVVGLHGAHLHHGSSTWYRQVGRRLEERLRDDRAAVIAGDLNCWGPLVRRFLPGWRRGVRGRSWPSWRPHSQIDHVLVRGAVRVVGGGAVDRRESDHRPVVCDLEVLA